MYLYELAHRTKVGSNFIGRFLLKKMITALEAHQLKEMMRFGGGSKELRQQRFNSRQTVPCRLLLILSQRAS